MQADFIRNGTAKGIMSMSKEHSTQLWNSVQDSKRLSLYLICLSPLPNIFPNHPLTDDYQTFSRISSILLNPATPLRHIPLRIYIPSSPTDRPNHTDANPPSAAPLFSFKIVQSLIPPLTPSREIQTLGSALNSVLPTLFPSRRDAILAEPILHGAKVPFRTPLEEAMREASYADGWVHLCVLMIDA